MLRLGERVEQIINTKTIPKGTIGFVERAFPSNNIQVSLDAYEIRFEITNSFGVNKLYCLRYSNEIQAAPVNTSTTQQMQQSMGLPTTPPPPVQIKLKQQWLLSHKQSQHYYLVEDVDNIGAKFKILKVDGTIHHIHVGQIQDYAHWRSLGWVTSDAFKPATPPTVTAKKCTCGAEKMYGSPAPGHYNDCDLMKKAS